MRFNPPPNWPPPPPGFTPPPGWQPDPSWSPPPPGWQLWVPDSGTQHRRGLIIAAGVAVLALAAVVAVVLVVVAQDVKPSDEEQIRQLFARTQDAWNDSDFAAFKEITCAKSELNEQSESQFHVTRDEVGRVEITVESIEVTGDTATAQVKQRFDNDFELETENYPMVREDGRWKVCPE